METISKTVLLTQMQDGWNSFQAFLKPLTVEQLTQPTDDAGWTAKDHIIHLAAWENGIVAVLEGQSRPDAMGVDEATWRGGDVDKINAAIQQRYKDMPLDEVAETLSNVHGTLTQKIETLSDEDLHRPYKDYQPDSTNDKPVIGWIIGNTYEHFAEHRPWIAAIVGVTGPLSP